MTWPIYFLSLLFFAQNFWYVAGSDGNCPALVDFDNLDMEINSSHRPTFRVRLTANFTFLTPLILRLQFANINISSNAAMISNFSIQQLGLPFEAHLFPTGVIRLNVFSDGDLHESRVVKNRILNELWANNIDYVTLLNDCLCNTPDVANFSANFPPCPLTWHHFANLTENQINEAVNWTNRGYVTNAKDQENCGSCWAFSSVALLEFYQKMSCVKAGGVDCQLLRFSEQSLVDWGSKLFRQLGGCDDKPEKAGGTVDLAYQAIRRHGIYLESDYPWKGKDQPAYDPANATRYYHRAALNPKSVGKTTIKKALELGPVTATLLIRADGPWKYWERSAGKDVESILKVEGKDEEGFDRHSVLIVGFGVYNGQNYWLIKNSWGDTWGDYGFAKIGTTVKTDSGIQIANDLWKLVV